MCYYCHDQGHNPGAPSHRSQNCRDPGNSWSKRNQQQAQPAARGGGSRAAVAAAVAPTHVPVPNRGEIRTKSLNNRIHPPNVDVAMGAKVGDGASWQTISQMRVTGPNSRLVIWNTGQMGTEESSLIINF
jgi:hypothetical protein